MNPFEKFQETVISARGACRVREGHPWIYASDLIQAPEEFSPVTRVLDSSRNHMGWAFYSPQSQIRLRILSRDPDPITPEFFHRRMERAVQRRSRAFVPDAGCRLIFSEADLLPTIIVDRYADCLVVQTLSAGADAIKSLLVDSLLELFHPAAIVERNDVKARNLEGLPEQKGVLWGNVPERVEIREGDVRFLVDAAGGQKTGFFLDQAENRMAAESWAKGKALDAFTHTGAFAIHFARKCESVLAVDTSRDALQWARLNADLNGSTNLEFREANVFDLLRELERAGESFDTICLDPPAFAKNRKALSGALGGYKEINLRAMRLMRPDGILITSSCSFHLSESAFAELIREAAGDVRRPVQVLEKRSQASDHPMLAGVPETHYLKCFVLRVV